MVHIIDYYIYILNFKISMYLVIYIFVTIIFFLILILFLLLFLNFKMNLKQNKNQTKMIDDVNLENNIIDFEKGINFIINNLEK